MVFKKKSYFWNVFIGFAEGKETALANACVNVESLVLYIVTNANAENHLCRSTGTALSSERFVLKMLKHTKGNTVIREQKSMM